MARYRRAPSRRRARRRARRRDGDDVAADHSGVSRRSDRLRLARGDELRRVLRLRRDRRGRHDAVLDRELHAVAGAHDRLGRHVRIVDSAPMVGRVLARALGFRQSRRVAGIAALTVAVASGIVASTCRPIRSSTTSSSCDPRAPTRSSRGTGWRSPTRRSGAATPAGQSSPPIRASRSRRSSKRCRARSGEPAERADVWLRRLDRDVRPRRRAQTDRGARGHRRLLDDPALDSLDPEEKRELEKLRPPDRLEPIPSTISDELARQVRRESEPVGYLISIRPANKLDEWNGRDLVRFASAVREIHLTGGGT